MLSPVLAQQIARETTEAIGYNVIITDPDGMVIGSGDENRVGTFHEASVDVLRTQESAWHTPDQARALQGVRPGITLPLVIGADAVGTVGITGSPRQVRRFGVVVRRQTEILLNESALLRTRLLRERALEDLVAEIAEFDPELVDAAVLAAAARELGFTLAQSRVPVLLEVDTAPLGPELLRTVRAAFHHHEDVVATRSTTRCLVLAHHRSRTAAQLETAGRRLVRRIGEQFGVEARAAVGDPGTSPDELRSACQDASDALRIGTRVRPGERLLRVGDLRAHLLLAGVPHGYRERFVRSEAGALTQTSDWDDLRTTVLAWCEHGFNLVAAAGALHIHRNTLVYRLDKIERLIGRPWRDHRAMVSLYLACVAAQLD